MKQNYREILKKQIFYQIKQKKLRERFLKRSFYEILAYFLNIHQEFSSYQL